MVISKSSNASFGLSFRNELVAAVYTISSVNEFSNYLSILRQLRNDIVNEIFHTIEVNSFATGRFRASFAQEPTSIVRKNATVMEFHNYLNYIILRKE